MPETAACIRWHAEATDKLYGQVAPSPEGTVATITREPVRRRRRGDPLELPGADGRLEARAGARDRQHRRHQAGVDDVAQPAADRGARRGGRASRTACSTSSPVPATPSARRSAATRTSTASRSPGSTEVGRRFLHYARGVEPQAGPPRARRQEPAARVRRTSTDFERRRRQRRGRDLLEHGRELLAPGSRLIVHRSREGPGCSRRSGRSSRNWPVGDPLDPATRIGALINRGPHGEGARLRRRRPARGRAGRRPAASGSSRRPAAGSSRRRSSTTSATT